MISEQFREVAAANRRELAIIDGDRRIRYGQLLEEVDRARNWFAAAWPGERPVVAVCLRNSWEFVASFFAVVELGGIFMLCNPNWRAAELRRLAGQIPISGVITIEALRAEWDRIADALPPESILTWETAPNCDTRRRSPAQRSAEEPLAYLLTSGSTGLPKVVPRSDRNLNFGATSLADALKIEPGSRWLSAIPFFHSWGLHTGMFLPLLRRATLVIMPHFQPASCAALIRHERVNVLMASPFAYGFLGDSVGNASDLASLDRCLWTGSRMKAAVEKTWMDRYGIRLRPWYGMSEAHAIATDLKDSPKPEGEGFVGQPVPGVEVRVFDPDGRVLGVGETGEVGVHSAGVMSGYAWGGEENHKVFYGPFFRTGDLGRLDADGHLYLSGRARMMINIAGLKVDATEIERTVEMLEAVAACRVDSVPGGPAGELIRARILLRQGFGLSRRQIVEHCRQELAEYKIPRLVEFSDASSSVPAGKMTA